MKNVAEEIKGLEIKTTAGNYLIASAALVSEYDDEVCGQEQTYAIVLGEKLGRDDIYPDNFRGESGEVTVVWDGDEWDIKYFGQVAQ